MKCTICGTDDNVQKYIHLPFSEGRSGHVTLKEWTPYCGKCARQQGDLFTKQMDELLRSRQ